MTNFFKFIGLVLLPFIVGGFAFLISVFSIKHNNKIDFMALFVSINSFGMLVFSIYQWKRFGKRCKSCGKWGTLKLTGGETINNGTTQVEVERKDGSTKYVRGKAYISKKFYKCSNCGAEFSISKEYDSVR